MLTTKAMIADVPDEKGGDHMGGATDSAKCDEYWLQLFSAARKRAQFWSRY